MKTALGALLLFGLSTSALADSRPTGFHSTTLAAGAIEVLEEDAPGDGVICRDGDHARPREEIQQQVVALISDFLATSKP
ncbi:hypothetical protein PMI25_004101 [Pseudomonas sp. GM30]|nr:hypothetical protein PMI25_004101 [Pseudomonas sp. GM30]